MSARGPALLLLLMGGCYSFGAPSLPGGVQHLSSVRALDRAGVDVDAAALLLSALRRRAFSGPEGAEGEGAELVVELVDQRTNLAALSDPGRRAGEYRAELTVLGRLVRADGKQVWSSPPIVASASYFSTTGGIESLDGQRRSALARAADEAAEKLLDVLRYSP
ncbi:MAG: LPS assembly lipoprotein LptE [Myxococcota bacterium]